MTAPFPIKTMADTMNAQRAAAIREKVSGAFRHHSLSCDEVSRTCQCGLNNAFDMLDELVRAASSPAVEVVDVVAAVRRSSDGRYWVCRRSRDGKHAGLAGMWEYPGGKVNANEQLRDALIRELIEEFGDVNPTIGAVLDSIEARYGDVTYRVTFFAVEMREPVTLHAHDETRWMTSREVCSVPHLPSGTIFNARHVAPSVEVAQEALFIVLEPNGDSETFVEIENEEGKSVDVPRHFHPQDGKLNRVGPLFRAPPSPVSAAPTRDSVCRWGF